MPIFKSVNGKHPLIPEDCYIAENATIVGEVIMGNHCSVWFNAVIRGDVHYIKMGNKVNVQDGAIIHATYLKSPTNIGNNVSIGHNAIVHGCTIHDNVLIGMGSIIMDDLKDKNLAMKRMNHRPGWQFIFEKDIKRLGYEPGRW